MKQPRAMHLSLTPKSAERLQVLAAAAGLTRSELIRRWIDSAFEKLDPDLVRAFSAGLSLPPQAARSEGRPGGRAAAGGDRWGEAELAADLAAWGGAWDAVGGR